MSRWGSDGYQEQQGSDGYWEAASMSGGSWGGRTEATGMSREVWEGRYDKSARVEAAVPWGK